MKTCKKCKNEYKDDYTYCSKCGQPYDDNLKRVKTPGDVSGSASSVLKLIWNIVLYIFGGFTILGCLFSIVEDPVSSIVGILFGLSLFQFIYKIIEDKTMIDTKYLKIARVVIPIVLLIVIGLVYKDNGQNTDNIKKTVCVYETSQKEDDGMTGRTNYNVIYQDKDNIYEESLTRYIFENDDVAYKYYVDNVEELKKYGNEVHLINNVINIFNDKKLSNEQINSSITLHEGLGSTCNVDDEEIIKKYNSFKEEFDKEKNKSTEYIESRKKMQNNENSTGQNNNQQTTQQSSTEQSNAKPSEPAYMEYLRKCTVMEAYDIITTGVGNKSGNAYVDAKKTCEGFYSSFGEKDFIDAVSTDWNSEQINTINGKTLTECINDLGW